MKFFSLRTFLLACMTVLTIGLSACGGGNKNPVTSLVFSATLTGAQETPPNNSAGAGIGILIFNTTDRSFTASVVTSGVAETLAHIHEAPPGVAGPIIFPLAKAQGSVVWTTQGTLTEAQETSLRNGNFYFNVHSPTFPNGEIRGQILRQFPTDQQIQQLQQFQQQSQLLAEQLRLIQQQMQLAR